jgi:hypothetical protein
MKNGYILTKQGEANVVENVKSLADIPVVTISDIINGYKEGSLDTSSIEVLGFENKSDDYINGVMWLLEKIDSLPTVDIDNIIENLRNDPSVKLYGSSNSNNYLIPLDRAIEIIRQVSRE